MSQQKQTTFCTSRLDTYCKQKCI